MVECTFYCTPALIDIQPRTYFFPCPVAMCIKLLYVVDDRDKHIARSNTQLKMEKEH